MTAHVTAVVEVDHYVVTPGIGQRDEPAVMDHGRLHAALSVAEVGVCEDLPLVVDRHRPEPEAAGIPQIRWLALACTPDEPAPLGAARVLAEGIPTDNVTPFVDVGDLDVPRESATIAQHSVRPGHRMPPLGS